MTREEQMATIDRLKRGELNLLVATSIGEEGLDIGEVDLIVCFDSGLTPIRLVQRMGRTGRQRKGRVLLLLMENEYEVYQSSLRRYRDIINILQDNEAQTSIRLYSFNPRMLPAGIYPKLKFERQDEEESQEKAIIDSKLQDLIDLVIRDGNKRETAARILSQSSSLTKKVDKCGSNT